MQACPEVALAVPLHARYPRPRDPQHAAGWLAAALSAAAAAELLQPTVLAWCPAPGGSGELQWQAVQAAPAQAWPVRWALPAGNLRHGPLAAAGTAAAVGACALAVLRALVGPAQEQPRRQKKAA